MENESRKDGLKFKFHEKGDIFESTFGKFLSIFTQHLPSATYESIWKEIPQERIKEINEKFKDVNWVGDLEVNINHSPIWDQLKRLQLNKINNSDRSLSWFSRLVFGLPLTLAFSLASKFTQLNYYNPHAESIQLYNENKYLNLAKVQLAENINTQKNPLLKELLAIGQSIPFVLNTLIFFKANQDVKKKLDTKERMEASQFLDSSSIADMAVDTVAILIGAGLGSNSIKESFPEYLEFSNQNPWFEPLAFASLGAGVAGGVYGYKKHKYEKTMAELNLQEQEDLLFNERVNFEEYFKDTKKVSRVPASVHLSELLAS